LSIDLSLWLLKPAKNERKAVLFSSLISSVSFVLLSIVSGSFYKSGFSVPGVDDFLTYGYFLIPYSIIQGVMGGFIGWYLANYILKNRIQKENSIMN